MPDDPWDEDYILIDLLFDTNMSIKDIAKELECTEYQINKRINELGLGWIKKKSPKLSRGHAGLYRIMQKLIPGESVILEHPMPERLRLDIFCPRFNIGAEYHGRQHFYYVEHFHGNMQGFRDSQERDARKEELCKEMGISLIVFRYNDELTEDVVFQRMMEAIENSTRVESKEKTSNYKGNPYYEAAKKRRNEWNRERYQKMKAEKKKKI